MNPLILYLCFLCPPQQLAWEPPKTWKTFNYKASPVKLHHRFRVTVRVRTNQSEVDELLNDNNGDIFDAIDDALSDPIDNVSDLVKYNIRASFKTKNRKYKFFVGKQTVPSNTNNLVGTGYLGVRIRF